MERKEVKQRAGLPTPVSPRPAVSPRTCAPPALPGLPPPSDNTGGLAASPSRHPGPVASRSARCPTRQPLPTRASGPRSLTRGREELASSSRQPPGLTLLAMTRSHDVVFAFSSDLPGLVRKRCNVLSLYLIHTRRVFHADGVGLSAMGHRAGLPWSQTDTREWLVHPLLAVCRSLPRGLHRNSSPVFGSPHK